MCSIIARLQLNIQYRGDTGLHSVRRNNTESRKELKEVGSQSTPEEKEANNTHTQYIYSLYFRFAVI